MNWRDWLNRLAFARRRRHARGRLLPLDSLSRGLATPDPSPAHAQARQQQEAELSLRYPTLATWPAALPAMVRAESLAALSLLDAWLPEPVPAARWLDVGAKNGAAVFGMATRAAASDFAALTLVELDAGRRYRDGSHRADHGVTLADAASRWCDRPGCVRYVAGDVRELNGAWDVITWFHPFLFEGPHLAWGLPLSLLDPEALLRHVISLLAPGGWLLIVNHTPAEAVHQRALLTRCLDVSEMTCGEASDPWRHPGQPRPVTRVRRVSRPA